MRKISEENGNRLFHQVRQSDSQIFEVTEQHFPEYLIIRTTQDSSIKFKRIFNLSEDYSGNCILEDCFEVDLGYPKIVQHVFRSKIEKAVKENLMKLKELLEFRIAVLQDGRVSKL